jgi:hypothetical protein
MNTEITGRLRRVLTRWISFADGEYQDWDEQPQSGYFFGGAYWYGLETSFTCAIYAAVGAKDKAIKALRYLCFTHDTGPAGCVRVQGVNPYNSGKKWGGQGDHFFKASQTGTSVAALGLAATLLWDQLDEETKRMVKAVTVYYADRWSGEEPRNGVYVDTQCEENGWTCAGISAAVHLFPDHPNLQIWKKAALKWATNSVSIFSDWITEGEQPVATTFHPDFTTENHGFVHPSYMLAGILLRGTYAVYSLLANQGIPAAILSHNTEIYDRAIKPWTGFDGTTIPVQGQDWWYNRQHEALFCHAFMNVIHRDPIAARLELDALEIIEKLQLSNSKGCLLEEKGEECIVDEGGHQTAKEMEFTSAYPVLIAYLLHTFGGEGVTPAGPGEVEKQLLGVYHYPFGCSIVHRTPGAFTSFSWRNHAMALSMSSKDIWDHTPLYANYTGTVDFHEHCGGIAYNEAYILKTETEQINRCQNGFGAITTAVRGRNRALKQNISLVSLPDGKSIYMERIHINLPNEIRSIRTGMIGIRNENYKALANLASGKKQLYLPNETRTYIGFYGKEPDQVDRFASVPYLNIGGNMGYVLFGSVGITYINRHQYPKWKGVEDVLILNDRINVPFTESESLPPFCIINLPNRTADETARIARQSFLMTDGPEGALMIETEGYLVFSNDLQVEQKVTVTREREADIVQLFEGNQTISANRYAWSGILPAYRSGYFVCSLKLRLDSSIDCALNISVIGGRVIMENESNNKVCLTIIGKNGDEVSAQLGENQITILNL